VCRGRSNQRCVSTGHVPTELNETARHGSTLRRTHWHTEINKH
jgi:hypothetical protein